jgi:Ca2+-binding EF-hand superfamily protein
MASEQQLVQLKAMFDKFDTNHDGALDRTEVMSAVNEAFPGKSWTEAEMDVKFKAADLNGDGVIDWSEFCIVASEILSQATG